MGLKETGKKVLTTFMERKYSGQLAQRKVLYDSWVRKMEKEVPTAGAMEDYVLFCQEKGRLNRQAKAWISSFFSEHPEVQIVYGDEDVEKEEGSRENPWYKPCWSPDLYLAQFYLGSVIAIRTAFLDDVKREEGFTEIPERFCDPAEVRKVVTACIRKVGGFERDCRAIGHCSHILFHAKEEQLWETYLESRENCAENPAPWMQEKVAVIIPSKDNPKVLKKCLDSLDGIPGLEIIIVDNGSSEENQRIIGGYTKGMTYLYHPMKFHFSHMCNIGAEAAQSEFLLFLNDDIEVVGKEWITAMKEKAGLPYVGAVGLKLYYPNSVKIQHAGITNLPVGPVHKMQFAEDNRSIYFDRNKTDVNCLAVTGACLMIEKHKFLEVGGFSESLPVAYNDVDLGFSLYEAGYHNVVRNAYYAYHHESLSRGNDETKEKTARLQRERERLYKRHPKLKEEDPYYPDGLSMDGLDSRIIPAYVSAGNRVQEAQLMKASMDMAQIREDQCVFLGLELSSDDCIRGYGVVLGDNNACYDRYVVLRSEAGAVYSAKTTPQYRQDLEENMPDQQNVALSGFFLHFSEEEKKKLQKGCPYQIGVLAVNKINQGKLIHWGNRYFTV